MSIWNGSCLQSSPSQFDSDRLQRRITMRKCDKCGKELKINDKIFTAVGLRICEECNKKSGGTISLDMVMNEIMKKKK